MQSLRPLVSKHNPQQHFPGITCYSTSRPSIKSKEFPKQLLQSSISRRTGLAAAVTSILLTREATFGEKITYGFELDFKMVAPDQTIEQAEGGIRGHAQALLQVKELLEMESWREAQKALRKSSARLKQDIYTIIQAKPGIERPNLRKLYSNLFNNVTTLDYAARDKDKSRVWQCYENIVLTLDNILSKV